MKQISEKQILSKTIKSNIKKRLKKLAFPGTQSYQGVYVQGELKYIIHTYGQKIYVYDSEAKTRVMRGCLAHLLDEYAIEVVQGMDIRIAICMQIFLLYFKCL